MPKIREKIFCIFLNFGVDTNVRLCYNSFVMRKNAFIVFFGFIFATSFANANVESLENALRATYTACVGIDDELADMKKLAGINTAVTGVGTGLGVGATVVGIKKAKVDEEVIKRLDKLRKYFSDNNIKEMPREDYAEFWNEVQNFDIDSMDDSVKQDADKEKTEIEELKKKSKKLGNWRTGLLGGTTATGVAGAIIAAQNRTDGSLRGMVDQCIDSVDKLKAAYMTAKMSGEDTADAAQIVEACGQYKYLDLSKIDKRAKGAMVSSVVTATAGAVGTVTSAMANSEKVRAEGGQKEKNLNTTSNVLAAGTAVSSAVATVFNASQIAVIKDTIKVAESCSNTLR